MTFVEIEGDLDLPFLIFQIRDNALSCNRSFLPPNLTRFFIGRRNWARQSNLMMLKTHK